MGEESSSSDSAKNGTAGFCEIGAARIHYRRTGGSGAPLILLHGLLASGACWTPLARSLGTDYDVIMPDARAHGASSAPPAGYRYPDHAADVQGLVRALGLSAPILLGHSMGGMTAALTASQDACLARGVVLVDPTFLSPPRQREVYESDVAERHRQLLCQNKSEVLADLKARHPHRSAEILDLIASARLAARMAVFEVLTPPNPEYSSLVQAIKVPVVLVIGDAGVVSFETARALQRLNSRVRIELIQGAGHGIPYDAPERLEEIVRSFLRTVVLPEL